MILEVLAYANDEAEAVGRVGRTVVTSDDSGMITVSDDGRGTDTRLDSDGRVIRNPVVATRDVRFFDVQDRPLLPDGLPRNGVSAVAALSPVLLHENHRANGAWSQTYRYGIPRLGPPSSREIRCPPGGIFPLPGWRKCRCSTVGSGHGDTRDRRPGRSAVR